MRHALTLPFHVDATTCAYTLRPRGAVAGSCSVETYRWWPYTCSMAKLVSKLKASSHRPTHIDTGSQVRWVSSWAGMVPTMPIIRPVSTQADTWWPKPVAARAASRS
jgi:hypothetical protein